jgi:demethylmenaquinone methyltransferase / 2-methoxy-6-polyprenyl-1,4-benzoquinol methylase
MTKPPVIQAPGRKEQVEQMFNGIAPRYDFLNHFLSLGIDKLWRKKLIRMLAKEAPRRILDLATGTGDLAIAALKANPESVVGTDISAEMLAVGQKKIENRSLGGKITLLQADSEDLPFKDASFDAAMVAFGVRNYEDLAKGLREMGRVLVPRGKAFILEFSKPSDFPVKQLYFFYFRHILPFIGKLVSKHESAYSYLPESVNAFPQEAEFLKIMENAGFSNGKCTKLSFGIASIYTGTRI